MPPRASFPSLLMRAFVNERGIEVDDGATVADAIRAFDPALALRVERGERSRVTDARGIEVALDTPVRVGDIFRVVISAREAAGDDDT